MRHDYQRVSHIVYSVGVDLLFTSFGFEGDKAGSVVLRNQKMLPSKEVY